MLLLVSLWTCLLHASSTSAICPNKCTCYLDNRGRNAVLCNQGGMVGSIPVSDMRLDLEVIKITAPDDNMNMLTMGPVFQDFKLLEELHVTKSNIPVIGLHFFWGLRKLDVLNLSQNNITQALDGNFRGLDNLTELYLDDNRIESLPSATFSYLPKLKILSIQRNRIKELMPRIFQELRRLRVLKLSGNHLAELNPEVFKDVQDLHAFECKRCGLNKINTDTFNLPPYLTHLDLGDNEFTSLTPGDFRDLRKLKSLKLDGNRLSVITNNTFSNQTELRKLNIARNKITKIEIGAFENMNNLTELDLSYNKLVSIDISVWTPITSVLEKLSLSGNRVSFSVIRDFFQCASKIREFRLADSDLFEIPPGLFPEKLKVLDVAGNHLSYLNPYSLPSKLMELDISRNHLIGLEEDALLRIESIPHLKLESNPWSCDLCHIVPLLARVNRSSAIHDITCSAPYACEGRLLGSLRHDELDWCSSTTFNSGDANLFHTGGHGRLGIIAAGVSVMLLFLTVVAVIGALYYSRRHAANYYTHEDKRGVEGESIFENHSALFGDERELSFKFPLDLGEKKMSIATIDEITKEHAIANGT